MTKYNEITVAGVHVPEPLAVLTRYALRYGGTLEKYDFVDRGDPNVLTVAEIWRSRIIASRVTHVQKEALALAAADCGGLWTMLPSEAHIVDANPAQRDGLFDTMLKLYERLVDVHGVDRAKASKILHFKRPHLFPILDSRLAAKYDDAAATAAAEYPELGFKRMYWAAIRRDVVMNAPQLHELRAALVLSDKANCRLAELSDIRLLDILGWSV